MSLPVAEMAIPSTTAGSPVMCTPSEPAPVAAMPPETTSLSTGPSNSTAVTAGPAVAILPPTLVEPMWPPGLDAQRDRRQDDLDALDQAGAFAAVGGQIAGDREDRQVLAHLDSDRAITVGRDGGEPGFAQ